MKYSILFIVLLSFSCELNHKVKSNNDSDLKAEAERLSHEFIIVDGHVDLPWRLFNAMEDISIQTQKGHFDYVRSKKGGLDAPFMSIYIPAGYENNGAFDLSMKLISLVDSICADYPEKFARANSPADIESNFSKGIISFPMGLENGAPIEGNLDNLDMLYERGIRYITLTHSKDNHICDSSYEKKYTHGGLSAFGYEVIDRMNQLGIMVDVAHVTDSAFSQAVKASKTPVIASHSSCRHFTPDFERNVSDDLIKQLAEHGGVIMINFGSAFLSKKGNESLMEIYAKIDAGADPNDPAIKMAMDSLNNSPEVMGNVATVADHIDHVVQIAGIDHVGLGSDYDGVDNVPIGLEDVSKYPELIQELLKRGYSADEVEKICSKNIFRVWNEVIDFSKKSKS